MPKYFSKSKDSNPVVPALIGIVLLIGLAAAFYLVSVPQDIRQQAASSCPEAPVNVQFRRTAQADRPWKPGSEINLKVGDTIDVNCFSKNGTATLSGGQILGALSTASGFQRLDLPGSPSVEVRAYTIQYPGKHIFVCTNTSRTCTDRDEFTATGTAAEIPPVPPQEPPADTKPPLPETPPGPADEAPPADTDPATRCNDVADLNQDCKVDVQDYNIFLRNFRNSFNAGN